MNSQWSIPCLDVFFCLLAAILSSDPKFNTKEDHQLSIAIPSSSTSDGILSITGNALEWSIDAEGIIYSYGKTLSPDQCLNNATIAFEQGSQEAVIRSAADAPVEAYVQALSALKEAGFQAIRLPISKLEVEHE